MNNLPALGVSTASSIVENNTLPAALQGPQVSPQQAFQNLVSNAARPTTPADIASAVSQAQSSASSDYARANASPSSTLQNLVNTATAGVQTAANIVNNGISSTINRIENLPSTISNALSPSSATRVAYSLLNPFDASNAAMASMAGQRLGYSDANTYFNTQVQNWASNIRQQGAPNLNLKGSMTSGAGLAGLLIGQGGGIGNAMLEAAPQYILATLPYGEIANYLGSFIPSAYAGTAALATKAGLIGVGAGLTAIGTAQAAGQYQTAQSTHQTQNIQNFISGIEIAALGAGVTNIAWSIPTKPIPVPNVPENVNFIGTVTTSEPNPTGTVKGVLRSDVGAGESSVLENIRTETPFEGQVTASTSNTFQSAISKDDIQTAWNKGEVTQDSGNFIAKKYNDVTYIFSRVQVYPEATSEPINMMGKNTNYAGQWPGVDVQVNRQVSVPFEIQPPEGGEFKVTVMTPNEGIERTPLSDTFPKEQTQNIRSVTVTSSSTPSSSDPTGAGTALAAIYKRVTIEPKPAEVSVTNQNQAQFQWVYNPITRQWYNPYQLQPPKQIPTQVQTPAQKQPQKQPQPQATQQGQPWPQPQQQTYQTPLPTPPQQVSVPINPAGMPPFFGMIGGLPQEQLQRRRKMLVDFYNELLRSQQIFGRLLVT
jgi:hypothetical protein